MAATADAGCEQVLEIALRHVERSYVHHDVSAVDSGLRDVQKNLDCVTGHVDALTSARVHRAQALGAHIHGNIARTDTLLRAMVHADPWLGVGDLVDPDHDLSVRLVAAEEEGLSETRSLLWPESGAVYVDGIPAALAPAEFPWMYQQIQDGGEVLATGWVDSGSSPPTLIGEVGKRAQVKSGWRLAGLTTGAIAGGLYAGAWVERKRYNEALALQNDVAARDARSMTNALTIGSIITGSAGGTFLIVGFAL